MLVNLVVTGVFSATAHTLAHSFVQDWWYPEVGGRGPSGWGSMFDMCAEEEQSPVDIRAVNAEYENELEALELSYPEMSKGYSVIHSQSDFSVRFAEPAEGVHHLTAESSNYYIKEIRFKSPSEHYISGYRYDLEVQLIHEHPTSNELAIVSLLYESGGGSFPLLDILLGEVPKAPVSDFSYYDHPTELLHETSNVIVQEGFNIAHIYPARRDYYMYRGSETKPPCTTNVTWYVMKEVGKVRQDQVAAIQDALLIPEETAYLIKNGHSKAAASFAGNTRPLQPIENRVVQAFTDIKLKYDYTTLDNLRLGTVGTVVGICTLIGVSLNFLA
eukprot:TRINITY_DN363_c3_g1_i1.p2 TRINITY_DN363_c3_g1~~TRINITY_DN363_c3_g1_i1.p2  ORF type:complete len:330 (+),score=47.61 TRINITY_DN363_c3_g1_i1:1656-2645(+)